MSPTPFAENLFGQRRDDVGDWAERAALADLRTEHDAAFPLGAAAWTVYPPTWTGTVGNGTLVGRYQRVGRVIHFYISLRWGSTTSHPAATQTFTAPVARIAIEFFAAVGVALLENAGVSLFTRTAFFYTGSATVLLVNLDNVSISNTVPFTWAEGDCLVINGTYEAAS